MSHESSRPSIIINESENHARYKVPDVCIHCGAPATVKKDVLLRCPLAPWIVYILALVIAEMFETKTTITLPLCDKHRKAKDANMIMKLITVFLVIPVVIAGIIVFATAPSGRNPVGDKLISVAVMATGLAIGWFLIRFTRARRFYGKSVDERRLKLIGVSPQFAAAVSGQKP